MKPFLLLALAALLSGPMLTGCSDDGMDPALTGAWIQNGGEDGRYILEFTRDNTVNVYRKFVAEPCFVRLLTGEGAMPFEPNPDGSISFRVMGATSILTYRIDEEGLHLDLTRDGQAIVGHGDFLTDTYAFITADLDTCTISIREWQERQGKRRFSSAPAEPAVVPATW